MSKTTTQTPQERIAAMQARVAEKAAAEKLEKAQHRVRWEMLQRCRDGLFVTLKALNGLPLIDRQSGRHGYSAKAEWDNDPDGYTVSVISHLSSDDYETLIEFRCECDGARAFVTHDGDRIDAGTALDLATAAVEARFDG